MRLFLFIDNSPQEENGALGGQEQQMTEKNVEYEQACRDKVPDAMSIRDRLRQKEQVVKIRETGRDDRTRHKDKGAR